MKLPDVASLLPLAALLAAPAVLADGMGTNSGPVFMQRSFSGEVPSAEDGRVLRLGVILPPKSKVVKVEAFMNEEDQGRSVGGWDACDLETGECQVPDGRVENLARVDSDVDVEVAASFVNSHPEDTQWAKLKVTFLPQGNVRKTYRPKECYMRSRCGFAGYMAGQRDGLPRDMELRLQDEAP
jgi:hypothetical protein